MQIPMDAKSLRAKNDTEVRKFLDETRRSLHELSQKAAVKQLKNVSSLRGLKRDIARALTILRERSTNLR